MQLKELVQRRQDHRRNDRQQPRAKGIDRHILVSLRNAGLDIRRHLLVDITVVPRLCFRFLSGIFRIKARLLIRLHGGGMRVVGSHACQKRSHEDYETGM